MARRVDVSDDPIITNRRGHTMSEAKAAADILPEPDYVQPSKPPVTRVRQPQRRRLSQRAKKTVILGIVLLLGLPLLAGEYMRWSYDREVSAVKKEVAHLLSTVVSKQTAGLNSTDLTKYDAQLAALRDGLCTGDIFDNLAALYPRSKTALADCNTFRSNVAALESAIHTAADQMGYLEKLQPLLGSVTKPLDEQFAVFAAQQEKWQSFVDSLKQLNAPLSLRLAHDGLVEQANTIHEQWIALVQSSNVLDGVRYRQARVKLTAGYTGFRNQIDAYAQAVATSQLTLTRAVAALKT